jgi:hypothetical protein
VIAICKYLLASLAPTYPPTFPIGSEFKLLVSLREKKGSWGQSAKEWEQHPQTTPPERIDVTQKLGPTQYPRKIHPSCETMLDSSHLIKP